MMEGGTLFQKFILESKQQKREREKVGFYHNDLWQHRNHWKYPPPPRKCQSEDKNCDIGKLSLVHTEVNFNFSFVSVKTGFI